MLEGAPFVELQASCGPVVQGLRMVAHLVPCQATPSYENRLAPKPHETALSGL
jgi:hypothetical protein